MFSQVTIHRCTIGTKTDLGLLAESMLFYNDIVLLLDRGSLIALIETLSPDIIVRLHDEFGLKLSYHREAFAVMSSLKDGVSSHRFTDFTMDGKPPKFIRSVADEIGDVVERLRGANRETRKFAKSLIDRVSPHILSQKEKVGLIEAANSDILDAAYSRYAAAAAVSFFAPSVKFDDNWRFGASNYDRDNFAIDTNIDFSIIDVEYRKVPGQESGSVNGAFIASHMFGARVESYFASSYMSGFVCDGLASQLMNRRFFDLVRRRNKDVIEIDLFQEKLIPEGKKLREAINAGEVSFVDALRVIGEARKFKRWLSERNPDETLLKAYFEEISRKSWLQKLPGKAFRWITSAGLGAVASYAFSPIEGVMAGAGLGAIDAFLVDRLVKGWRPDQFVSGSLAKLIKGG
jgi:hypothetical protein